MKSLIPCLEYIFIICQRIGLPPISIIGFGFKFVSSLILVPKPPATPLPNTSKTKLYVNEDNEIGCKACGKTCMIKRSSSEKNYGKEYYACQDFCNIWNGWVEDEVNQPIEQEKQVEKQFEKQPEKQLEKQPEKQLEKQPAKKQKVNSSKKIFNMLPEEF